MLNRAGSRAYRSLSQLHQAVSTLRFRCLDPANYKDAGVMTNLGRFNQFLIMIWIGQSAGSNQSPGWLEEWKVCAKYQGDSEPSDQIPWRSGLCQLSPTVSPQVGSCQVLDNTPRVGGLPQP